MSDKDILRDFILIALGVASWQMAKALYEVREGSSYAAEGKTRRGYIFAILLKRGGGRTRQFRKFADTRHAEEYRVESFSPRRKKEVVSER